MEVNLRSRADHENMWSAIDLEHLRCLSLGVDGAKARLAVIIPARNEEHSVAEVVRDFSSILQSLGRSAEIIVIDDHSGDDTCRQARIAGARVVALRGKRGLAEAFRVGVQAALAADAEYIVHVDADSQYSAKDLPTLLERIITGCDLVIGNRLWRRPVGMSKSRYFANRTFSRLVADLGRVSIGDSQSGYRLFNRAVAAGCAITTDYTYTQEQILRAGRAGFDVGEVPVEFRARQHGTSRLISSVIGYSWQVIRSVQAVCRSLDIPVKSFPGRILMAILRELCRSPNRHGEASRNA